MIEKSFESTGIKEEKMYMTRGTIEDQL